MKSKFFVMLLIASFISIVSVPAVSMAALEDSSKTIASEVAAKTALSTIIKKYIIDMEMPLEEGFLALMNADVDPAVIVSTAIAENGLSVCPVIKATLHASSILNHDPGNVLKLLIQAAQAAGVTSEEITACVGTDEVFGFTPAPGGTPPIILLGDGIDREAIGNVSPST